MPTFADLIKPKLSQIRSIPGQLGLRPHRVFLVTSVWSTSSGDTSTPGVGSKSTSETELLEGGRSPKVRQLNDERLALSNMPAGTLEIGPITPGDATTPNRLTAAQILGKDLLDKDRMYVRVTGPLGDAIYRVAKTNMDKALHFTLTISPLEDLPNG